MRLTILVIILSIVAWVALVYFLGAQQIVEFIGVENGYYIMFFIALFGGVSSFTGVSYAATIVTLAGGGLDPLFLALASAAGVSIGDTVYYVVSRHGQRMLKEGKSKQYIDRLSHWLHNKSKWTVAGTIYLYTAFTPLPNDVLTIAMGLTRQPYLLVITALVLGNFTLTYLIAGFGTSVPFVSSGAS